MEDDLGGIYLLKLLKGPMLDIPARGQDDGTIRSGCQNRFSPRKRSSSLLYFVRLGGRIEKLTR